MATHALITGATSGLGLETARGLARAGFAVIVTGRSQQAADAVAASLGPFHVGLGLDVTSEPQARLLAKRLEAEGVAVSVLVHNAGVLRDEPGLDAASLTLETNLFGPVRITQALQSVLTADARVVLVSSAMSALAGSSRALRQRIAFARTTGEILALAEDHIASFGRVERDRESPDAYGLSKALLNALAVAWSLEFPGRVTVAVSPGWISTRMGGAGAPHSVQYGASRIVSACIAPVRTGGFYGDSSAVP